MDSILSNQSWNGNHQKDFQKYVKINQKLCASGSGTAYDRFLIRRAAVKLSKTKFLWARNISFFMAANVGDVKGERRGD